MLLSLAFVPINDLQHTFQLLRDQAPESALSVFEYFKETCVIGRPGRGRRRAVPPRYSVPVWIEYEATLNNEHRTNNVSEGRRNRFGV